MKKFEFKGEGGGRRAGIAVCEQVRGRPEYHRQHLRMPDDALDIRPRTGGHEKNEREEILHLTILISVAPMENVEAKRQGTTT